LCGFEILRFPINELEFYAFKINLLPIIISTKYEERSFLSQINSNCHSEPAKNLYLRAIRSFDRSCKFRFSCSEYRNSVL